MNSKDKPDPTLRVMEVSEMGLVCKFGQTAVDTKATGRRIKQKERVNSSMLTVMYTRATG